MNQCPAAAFFAALAIIGGCASHPRANAEPRSVIREPPASQEKIADMQPVAVAARYLARKYGKKAVLVVYDIDNTLLASTTQLGSDQWFTWQNRELPAGDAQRMWGDGDFACLLDAQELLYNTRPMRLTSDSVPATVGALRAEGFTQWVLTSRGKEVSSVTFRELRRQGLSFSPFSRDLEFSPSEFHFDATKLDEYYDAELQRKRRLGVDVRLESGVYMTSGMHKGSALLLLLDRLGLKSKIRAVVFVDDTNDHVIGMDPEMKRLHIDVRSYRYMAEDTNVENFKDPSTGIKAEATREWCALWPAIPAIESSFSKSVLDSAVSRCAVNICKK